MRDVGALTIDVLLKIIAVVVLVGIAGLLFFGALRDGQWYNLPFAWVTVAVGAWWTSQFINELK